MATYVQQITSEQLTKVITSKTNVLVKIGSTWNGASQIISQTLQDMALQYGNQVDFFSIDYEPESALVLAYQVDTTPTILFFKEGALIDKLCGLAHRAIISHKISQLAY